MRPTPILKPVGSSLFVIYAPSEACAGITLEFSRVVEGRDTITAEITITTEGAGEVAWDRINLLAARTRASLAKTAEHKSPEAPWPEVVEESCRAVVRHLRAGEPSIPLVPLEPSPEEQCLVPGLIYRNEVNLIFADGGSTKSLLALAIALSGILQHPLSKPWTVAPVTRAMYLDWESNETAHAKRMWGLCSWMERPPDGTVRYLQMLRPLTDQLDSVQAECDRHAVDLVICDSLAPASGLEPESGDASIRTLQALRSMRRTVVCLAHLSAARADGNGEPRPYGSVFNRNLARSAIYMKAEDGASPGLVSVSLVHKKVNDGRTMPPSALEWTFEPTGAIRCQGSKVSTEYLSLPAQILASLAAGTKTAHQLRELTGKSENIIRARLDELETAHKVVRFSAVSGGRGNKSLWGLALTNRTP